MRIWPAIRRISVTRRNAAIGIALGACLALAMVGADKLAPPPPGDEAQQIQAILLVPDVRITEIDRPQLRRFYAQTEYGPAWGDKDKQETMRAALDHAADDGLDPVDYHAGLELFRRPAATPREAAERDILLTDGALKFARDMRKGRARLRAIDRDVDLPDEPFDPASALAGALRANALESFLSGLAPPHAGYARLKTALQRYREIAAAGGWPALPPARADRFANDDDLSRRLRARLVSEDASAAEDADITEAVKRFQRRHGLDSDGRVGVQTLRALNVPASERVLEIAANMERWRWLPRVMEKTYVTVNVPDARLDLVADGQLLLSSPVIVGRAKGPTPILRAVASSVTVNPPWNVPASIARKEMLPKLKSNPSYLASENMILVNGPPDDPSGVHINWRSVSAARFPYEIRQLPGPKNALGQIKLELPNRFAVYLHDTPGKSAFDLNERYLSHGCVRVEKIRELASFALAGDTASAVPLLDADVAVGATAHLTIPAPLPIYLLYWTAFVDDDGTVEFRKDIYGRDRRLIDVIQGRPTVRQVTFNVPQCRPA